MYVCMCMHVFSCVIMCFLVSEVRVCVHVCVCVCVCVRAPPRRRDDDDGDDDDDDDDDDDTIYASSHGRSLRKRLVQRVRTFSECYTDGSSVVIGCIINGHRSFTNCVECDRRCTAHAAAPTSSARVSAANTCATAALSALGAKHLEKGGFVRSGGEKELTSMRMRERAR